MRKTLFILATILAFIVHENISNAQDWNGIPTGPIPKLNITRERDFSNSGLSSASIAYGHSSIQTSTLSMPIPSGTPFTLLFPYTSSGFASSMCKGGDGKYYLIEYYFIPPIPEPSLYEFNPVTGSLTLLGTITGLGTEEPTGIAYNLADGTYYICTGVALYSFNLSSRTASYIGNFGLTDGYMIDLCFNASGVCYAIAIGSAKGYTIDITTGVPTLLGPLGYYAIYGHGMSYDFETNTIYISAYNHTPQTGQLRTMDPSTGNTTLVTDWGFEQVAPFAIDSYYGPPCPIGSPTNPYPVNGSTGVSITENVLTWNNGNNTTNVEIWFGTPSDVIKVYDGSVISSWELDTLIYSTTYNWRIICKNDTCASAGPYWNFLTESDSSIIFYEPFNNLDCWTAIGPQGIQNWFLSYTNYAGGSLASEVKLKGWDYNAFNGLSQLISCPITDDSYHYIVKLKHMLDIYSGSSWQYIGLAVSYDGGITKQTVWQSPILGNMGPEEIETEFYPSSNTFQMILYFNGYSIQIENWFVDDLKLIDDCMECFPPAAPSNLLSFHYFNPRRVLIYWQDNSWNEEGFKVFRKNGFPNDTTQYQLIGTVTQNHHNFWDYNIIIDSTYTYRVMAFNQYGNSDTSVTTTITIPIPVELLSFTATVVGEKVILNWSTATELNNLGFEIERRSETEYYTIGFVKGFGTTTEIQNYSYSDFNAEKGFNYYRLKQIDFNGKSTYSEEIEIDFTGPVFFSLEQNYPNPFNPSTNIEFNLVVDSKVSLKIYDVLGQEITQLVNSSLTAGNHNFDFNASYLNSGIYFYKLEAIGKDGTNFTAVKKMILAK